MASPDLYFSCDIEADGPIPGPYSMLSFGFSVAGSYDGAVFTHRHPFEKTYYAELKPISDAFEPEALAVSGLDRENLKINGRDPAEAMTDAAAWVREVAREAGAFPVFAAYPLGFDWMWMYHYFVQYAEGGSPFGFSRCLDMKSLYAARGRTQIRDAVKAKMPRGLLSGRRHTHNALDDAVEQAELLQNLMTWDGARAR
ncbi:exonuclease [Actinocorallia longicatena]|uniref:Exonuclease n=1 Tax=Actinocorallia longicatena TaxID=111803 RepID=A0ABP6Q4R6_9ACTN